MLSLCCTPESQYLLEEIFTFVWCPGFYVQYSHFFTCYSGVTPDHLAGG